MKRIILLALLLAGCTPDPKTPARYRERVQEESQRVAKETLIRIAYVHDVRTNLCFAEARGRDDIGVTALTLVPCESIPKPLLVKQD